MGYEAALVAAGTDVKNFGRFGDWHGSWYAKVEFEGETRLIGGAYGSCPHCDPYNARFEYDVPTDEELAAFGREYLDDPLVPSVEIASAREQMRYDLDAKEMYDWLVENFPT